MQNLADVLAYLERFAPLELAASWDNVGLLLGDRHAKLKRVLTCLTITPEVVAEACAEKAGLIVAHHPILFKPIQKLTTANPEGRLLLPLLQAKIAVYSPHTAFDNTAGGINDLLAQKLGLTEVRPLRLAKPTGQSKLVVFVPESDLEKVSQAVFAAGAGKIGAYRECSFRTQGTGTFFGTAASTPSIGEKGRRENVAECRLEVLCPDAILGSVLSQMRKAHSYEEPAYDIYPLKPQPATVGEGRVGNLAKPTTLAALSKLVKEQLHVERLQRVGQPDWEIRRVALACGAGGELFQDALRAKADLFLSGEMRFHDYLTAEANEVGLLLPGHYATERVGIEMLADKLQAEFPKLEVWASRQERDPAQID